jgi:hypothetical protein
MNWRVVDRFVGIILLGMIFLYLTGYGLYALIKTELWIHWFFLVSFIPIWMVVTASLLGEIDLASLKVSIQIGQSYLKRWWRTVKEMWMSLKDYMMRYYNR